MPPLSLRRPSSVGEPPAPPAPLAELPAPLAPLAVALCAPPLLAAAVGAPALLLLGIPALLEAAPLEAPPSGSIPVVGRTTGF